MGGNRLPADETYPIAAVLSFTMRVNTPHPLGGLERAGGVLPPYCGAPECERSSGFNPPTEQAARAARIWSGRRRDRECYRDGFARRFPIRNARDSFCLHCVALAAAFGQIEGFADWGLNDGFVDEDAALAILDLDDPDVGIEADLLGEVIGASLLVGGVAERPCPDELFAAAGG